jgi:hypothetical protein
MEDLSYILDELNSKDSLARNGVEKEKTKGNFIFREADFSVRVLYKKENEIIAGLHFVKFGNRQVISEVYTKDGFREQGYMSKIIAKAREKYGQLEHSKHSTDLGKLFINADENKTKKSNNKKPT